MEPPPQVLKGGEDMGDDFEEVLALNEDQKIVDLVMTWHNRGYEIHREDDGRIVATVPWRKDNEMLLFDPAAANDEN